jgi:hypothetical protein
MFRLPILFVLAGLTGFMLYKNEKQRQPANADGTEQSAPMLSQEALPQAPSFSDEDFSDSDASISDLDISRN